MRWSVGGCWRGDEEPSISDLLGGCRPWSPADAFFYMRLLTPTGVERGTLVSPLSLRDPHTPIPTPPCSGLLNHFIPDVYIATDHSRGSEGGASPGYGAQLTAFSTSGCVYGSQRCTGAASGTSVASAAVMMGGVAGATPAQPPLLSPEDLGRAVAAAQPPPQLCRGSPAAC